MRGYFENSHIKAYFVAFSHSICTSGKKAFIRKVIIMKRSNVLRDSLLTAFVFSVAVVISIALSNIFDDNNQFSIPVFILVVTLVSRYTDGYIYGIIASVLGVLCVNYIFTYPFWAFNITITGYPLTFAAMLFVSITICTLTTQVKKREQLRLEIERERIRTNLLRSVSHDIRTPLTSIIGSSSLLLQNPDAPDRLELLDSISKDAQGLVRMTENILSVTKFSGENAKLVLETEIVEELIGSAIVKFRKHGRDIPISVSQPDEMLTVKADATLIVQVLLNLLDNVVAHAPTATHINIKVSKANGFVEISVADNGEGIDKHALEHLFDGLAAESVRDDSCRNMGIGLTVCSAIMHAHDGDIYAYNDNGAVFAVRLPECEEEYPNGGI